MRLRLGFTLIELLVAMSIFSLVAVIAAAGLSNMLKTNVQLAEEAKRLAAWQMAFLLLERSINTIVLRSVYLGNTEVAFAFIGQERYLEFTYSRTADLGNSGSLSNLSRTALICRNEQLIQRNWFRLDTSNKNNYQEKILLEPVICRFSYLDKNLRLLTNWPQQAILPKAIQFRIVTEDKKKKLSLLFIVPQGTYGFSQRKG